MSKSRFVEAGKGIEWPDNKPDNISDLSWAVATSHLVLGNSLTKVAKEHSLARWNVEAMITNVLNQLTQNKIDKSIKDDTRLYVLTSQVEAWQTMQRVMVTTINGVATAYVGDWIIEFVGGGRMVMKDEMFKQNFISSRDYDKWIGGPAARKNNVQDAYVAGAKR